jgi:hypothetical protein
MMAPRSTHDASGKTGESQLRETSGSRPDVGRTG